MGWPRATEAPVGGFLETGGSNANGGPKTESHALRFVWEAGSEVEPREQKPTLRF